MDIQPIPSNPAHSNSSAPAPAPAPFPQATDASRTRRRPVRRFFGLLGIAVLGTLIALGVTFGAYVIFLAATDTDSGTGDTIASGSGYDLSGCNVVGVEIRGCIVPYAPSGGSSSEEGCDTLTSSESVVEILAQAKGDDTIKALLLEVDSPGGAAFSGGEIADAVADFNKPSTAWIRSQAASAAYWGIVPASIIVGGANSDIGSIGAAYSYVDQAEQDEKNGLTYNQLTTGKFKDLGSIDKPLTGDERSLIERDLYITKANFVDAVANYRKLPRESVEALADGSTMLGAAAKQNGLIDIVGGKKEVWDQLRKQVGDEPSVCWPQYQDSSI